jgi:3D (Asp-Asp-Asp) domain-containing protein
MALETAALAFAVTMYAVGCDVKPGHPTKSGVMPVAGYTVAADPNVLPIGSIVHIDGLGERIVHDIGPAVRGLVLDVYVTSCADARLWGRRKRMVKVLHVPTPRRRK